VGAGLFNLSAPFKAIGEPFGYAQGIARPYKFLRMVQYLKSKQSCLVTTNHQSVVAQRVYFVMGGRISCKVNSPDSQSA
jgi:hypothetical protein